MTPCEQSNFNIAKEDICGTTHCFDCPFVGKECPFMRFLFEQMASRMAEINFYATGIKNLVHSTSVSKGGITDNGQRQDEIT